MKTKPKRRKRKLRLPIRFKCQLRFGIPPKGAIVIV